MNADWRVGKRRSVGRIHLFGNPLLKRPLLLGELKQMLLGHWGSNHVTTLDLCAASSLYVQQAHNHRGDTKGAAQCRQ